MGKVEAFSIPGCRCFFFSGDHGPPHFHVEKPGEWEVRVYFHEEPIVIEFKWRARHFPASMEREIVDLVAEHREELWTEWSEKVVDGDG